jgi:hypothetical protein
VDSIRLPRPAAPRGLTASQDGDVLYVRVPLERETQPSWHAARTSGSEPLTESEQVSQQAETRRGRSR